MSNARLLRTVGAAVVSILLTGAAFAQQAPVKIGAIYPLSGNAASPGQLGKAGIEIVTDLINNSPNKIGDLPLFGGKGLPGLGGAKVEVVFADNQGTPAGGQNQALRLITEEKVVALNGAYQSGITLTASAMSEKYGIPFVCGDSVAAILTERGFKWFFRVTPIASDFANIYSGFLKDMASKGSKIGTIAVVHENTEYGISVSKVIADVFKANGLNIALDIPYNANTTDVQAQVLQLKDKSPDVVIMVSYSSDAILFAKTMKELGYKPPMLLADDAGFSDPSTLKAVGTQLRGVFNRSSWGIGAAGTPSYIINDLFKKKTGFDLDDTTARMIQGYIVLVDAINRAGSTDPAKIQAALKATDLKPNQLIMGYKGVKFNDKGQNELAAGLMIQLEDDGTTYTPVWPKDKAQKDPVMPYKGW